MVLGSVSRAQIVPDAIIDHAVILKHSSRHLVLGIVALTLSIVYGIWYSYSVIMVALLKEFGWSRSVLAGAFSLFTLMHGISNPVIGALCARVSPPRIVAAGGGVLAFSLWLDSLVTQPWHLYLSFGVGTAVGVAMSGWVPALVQAQRRFPDRLGLAIGIVSAGVGLGILLVVPVCQLLIDAYGWRTAFRVLAVTCVVWIVPAGVYVARTSAAGTRDRSTTATDGGTSEVVVRRPPVPAMTLAEAARTAPFWLVIGASIFGNICAQTMHVHQVVYLVDHGLSAIVAATVVSVVGAASIVAKILGGWASDHVDREFVYIGGALFMVVAMLALMAVGASPSHWGAYGYALLLGVGYSVTASVMPAIASDRFSGPHFGAIVGMALMASAIGSALGPWLAGYLFDITGSYFQAFVIALGCGLTAAILGYRLRQLRLRAACVARTA